MAGDGFVGGDGDILKSLGASPWLQSLILDGAVAGVGAVLSFLPQILLLFLFLSPLLEDSGYMAPGRLYYGLSAAEAGALRQVLYPPCSWGFGCTTPAVMAARTMENEKERRMTIMLTPFMSCSARLPIYAVFAGTFSPPVEGL